MRRARSCAQCGAVDLAGVLVDQGELAVVHAARLMEDLGQHPERGENGHVVRVVVHDDARVGAQPMQFGVDVDRGRDIPTTREHLTVGRHHADVGSRHLVPPESPRIHEQRSVGAPRP